MEGLEIYELDGQRGVRLVGELTAESAPQLAAVLAGMQGNGGARLDLSGVTFVDSAGLHAIAAFARSDNGSGGVIVEGAAPEIIRLFEITKLAEHVDIAGSDDGR